MCFDEKKAYLCEDFNEIESVIFFALFNKMTNLLK